MSFFKCTHKHREFGTQYILYAGCKFSEMVDDLVQKHKTKAQEVMDVVSIEELSQYDGMTISLRSKQIIWIKKPIDGVKLNVLAHEILHAVKRGYVYIGVEDEECECYMQGFLTEKFHIQALKYIRDQNERNEREG